MTKFAYIRVSTLDQNADRQFDLIKSLKIPKENIFTEKLSGKNMKRPQLRTLLSKVKSGDSITVESISRFARNAKDLLDLVEMLSEKGVEFISLKENIDTHTPTGKFMLTIFGAVAELERGYILERQAEGIAAARARGKHLGRPAKGLPEGFGETVRRWEQKEVGFKKALEECGGVSATTFYKWLRGYRREQN